MLGTKIRNFAPLSDLSLEALVPKDNFYRRLDRKLDLSFVRDLVEDCYASCTTSEFPRIGIRARYAETFRIPSVTTGG